MAAKKTKKAWLAMTEELPLRLDRDIFRTKQEARWTIRCDFCGDPCREGPKTLVVPCEIVYETPPWEK